MSDVLTSLSSLDARQWLVSVKVWPFRQIENLPGNVFGGESEGFTTCKRAALLAENERLREEFAKPALWTEKETRLQKWDLNPRAWLTWYLQACAKAGSQAPQDIAPFLPWNLSPQQRNAITAGPLAATTNRPPRQGDSLR